MRAEANEAIKKVKFRAYTDDKEIAAWEADLLPAKVHTRKLNFKGPVRLEADPHAGPEMVIRTEDLCAFLRNLCLVSRNTC